MDYAIGGIVMITLIIGIVEAAKEFGVEGKASRALALFLGFFFTGLALALKQGLVPEVYIVWVELFVIALSGGLGAMGYYDLSKKFRTQ